MVLVSADMVQGCLCAVPAWGCDFSLLFPFEGCCWPFAPILEPAEVPSCWRQQNVVPAACLLVPLLWGQVLALLCEQGVGAAGVNLRRKRSKKDGGFFSFSFYYFFFFCWLIEYRAMR